MASRAEQSRVNAEWLQTLRKEKSQTIVKDVQRWLEMQRSMHRIREQRLEIPQADQTDVSTAIATAHSNHLASFNRLLTTHKSNLETLTSNLTKDLDAVVAKFHNQRAAIEAVYAPLCAQLEARLATARAEYEQINTEMRQNHEERRDRLEYDWNERLGLVKILAEEQLSRLHAELKAANEEFETTTSEQRTEIAALRQEDAHFGHILERRTHKVQRLHEAIVDLRRKLASEKATYRQQTAELQAKKGELLKELTAMQQEFIKEQKAQESELKKLLLDSASTEDELREKLQQATRIIKLQH